jgi:hypothetical protein
VKCYESQAQPALEQHGPMDTVPGNNTLAQRLDTKARLDTAWICERIGLPDQGSNEARLNRGSMQVWARPRSPMFADCRASRYIAATFRYVAIEGRKQLTNAVLLPRLTSRLIASASLS